MQEIGAWRIVSKRRTVGIVWRSCLLSNRKFLVYFGGFYIIDGETRYWKHKVKRDDMATVYLNIGLPKTDATAVQDFLRENKDALKKQGYCFPNFQIYINEKNRNGCFLLQDGSVRGEAFQELEELAKEYDYIILSDEEIWQAAAKNPQFWKETPEDFEKIGCRLKVIVYLYRQDLLAQSLWLSRVQSNVIKETESFQACLECGALADFPMDYHECLTEISEAISKENLLVRVGEEGQLKGEEHSVFSDFFEAVGLTLTKEFSRETLKEDWVLKGNFIEIKRILNSVPEYRKMEDFMCESIASVSKHLSKSGKLKNASFFAPGAQAAYLKQFDESNKKAAQAYLDRADGRLFHEPVEELPTWQADLDAMPRDILLFGTSIFCLQEKELQTLSGNIQELEDNFLFKICKKAYKKIWYRK